MWQVSKSISIYSKWNLPSREHNLDTIILYPMYYQRWCWYRPTNSYNGRHLTARFTLHSWLTFLSEVHISWNAIATSYNRGKNITVLTSALVFVFITVFFLGFSYAICFLYSQCNRTVALDAFVKQIVQYPVKIGWIGSGCSLATEPTAEITQHYNITQVQPYYAHIWEHIGCLWWQRSVQFTYARKVCLVKFQHWGVFSIFGSSDNCRHRTLLHIVDTWFL